ncbi:LysR family transcriptional regulator [Salmonella enterica]|nr:LysR family transcriptional regulator [Salmonella enterica]EMB7326485.1 LysR family transcriptional regulator [Salmonella enterica]
MEINLLEHIRIFIEIVESGSLTRAAEHLRIQRPAVTRALQQLERQSGVRLLQRTTRHISMTPEGEDFFLRGKTLLAQADDFLETFSPSRALSGRLRVNMPVSFATLLVIPNLPDFCQKHPDLEIILSSSDRRQSIYRDGLDCILRMGDTEDGDYIARPLGDVAITTCASSVYLNKHGVPDSLDDLQHHQALNFINSNNNQIVPWEFATSDGPRKITLPGRIILDNSEAYIAAGLAGLGLMQGMNFFLQPYINSGRLVEVLPEHPAPARKLSLVYPHRNISRRVRVFAEWLEGLLGQQ